MASVSSGFPSASSSPKPSVQASSTTQPPSSAAFAPVPPPTPQEVRRKLSMHNRPAKKSTNNPTQSGASGGGESDSDYSDHPQLSSSQSGGHTQDVRSQAVHPTYTHALSTSPSSSSSGTAPVIHALSLSPSTSAGPLSSIAESYAESASGSRAPSLAPEPPFTPNEPDNDSEDEDDLIDEHEGEADEPCLAESLAEGADWLPSSLSGSATLNQGQALGNILQKAGKEKKKRLDGDKVVKAGYLWKKGERRKTWKKRYLVLRPPHLAFYATSAEYELLRLVPLTDIHSCSLVTLKRHPYALGLVSPSRTWYLAAENEEDARSWVEVLENARESLVGTDTVGSIGSASGTQTPLAGGPSAQGVTGGVPMMGSRRNSSVSHAPTVTVQLSTSPQRVRTVPIAIPGGGTADSHRGVAVSGASHSPTTIVGGGGVVTSESDSEDAGGGSVTRTSIMVASPSRGGGVGVGNLDGKKVVLSGYLMKNRSKRKGWRKRWFVLTGERLSYSASHMETKRARTIPLGDILDALEYELPSQGHGHHHYHGHGYGTSVGTMGSMMSGGGGTGDEEVDGQHTFKVVTTKRSLVLSAPSEQEEIQWLSAVRALIARRNQQQQAQVQPGGRRRSASGGV